MENSKKVESTKPKDKIGVAITISLLSLFVVVGLGTFYFLEMRKDKEDTYKEAEKEEVKNEQADKEESKNEGNNNEMKSNTETEAEEEEKEQEVVSDGKCEIEFTDEENLMFQEWNLYNNEKYGFSLKYPDGFVIVSSSSDGVRIIDNGSPAITIEAGKPQTHVYLDQPDEVDEDNVEVFCTPATKKSYKWNADGDFPQWDNKRVIITEFLRDGNKLVIYIEYTYVGASVSSDIVEMYNLMLKSIVFKD